MSTKAAYSSLGDIEASLDPWEQETLNHPLLSTNGSQTLVFPTSAQCNFRFRLLNNVTAMIKNANRPPSDEVAHTTVLEAARPFHELLGDANKDMETGLAGSHF